ncbi:hypothetical protein JRO89_XS06G0097100 [Xanthoceras sorbifolium]|uniref:Thioredoxin domain-containing protein n=1 Tax=Xanthoceras sorbifolium TaxID=99658 RepID=A0ABQ8HXH5_9ROSI|nr:hypothetical protein JRO89_XS06G0097100 [Xanthoceras sorbifolium]
MEGQQDQQNKSRVVKVDSVESWDYFVSQANTQGCPLTSSYPDVLFLTVDVDEVKDVATKMEIKAMPTFLLMREGAVADKLVGANPEEIRKRIDGFVQSIRVFVA